MATNPALGFDSDQYTSEGEFYRSRSPEQRRLDEKRDYAFGGGLLKGITELPLELMEFMSPEDEYVPGALAPSQSSPRQRIRTERLHGEQFYEELKADPDTAQAAKVGYGASFIVDPIIDTGIGLAPHLVKGFKAISKGERAAPKLANLLTDEVGAVGDISDVVKQTEGERLYNELEEARRVLKENPDDRAAFRNRNRLQRTYDQELALQRKEAERAKPKIEEDTYQGQHQPAMREEGVRASGDDLSDIYPEDIYGMQGAQYYGHGGENVRMDNATIGKIREMRGKPDKSVFIYRAIPKNVDASSINKGDWVTINRDYAKLHGESTLRGEYKILKKKVKSNEIFTSGDSIHEWGYDPKGNIPVEMSKTTLREVFGQ